MTIESVLLIVIVLISSAGLIVQLVLSSGLLADGGVFVFEHGAKNDFSHAERFLEHRAYGSVNFSIFK